MFNKKTKIIAVITVVLLLTVAVGWFLFSKKDWRGNSASPSATLGGGKNSENGGTSPSDSAEQTAEKNDREVYVSPLGFSFFHSTDLTVTAFDEGQGAMFLVRDQKNAGSKREFQIFAVPFDEGGPLTAARIHKDLPGMAIENPQTVLIGSNKDIEALLFSSENSSIGKTREVWFVYGGTMYQVTGYADADVILGPILETWAFSE